MDEHDGPLSLDAATARVRDLRATALEDRATETVALDRIAGRVLAEPVVADADNPPHDYATMDGYAFDADEAYPLELVDAGVYPEDEPPSIDAGEAVEVATGAPLPERANAVLKREDGTVADGQLSGRVIEPGHDVYERGSNVRAGETLFGAGERLSPKDAILLRDLGIEPVAVRERLSAGVLAMGTEIHEGRQPDRDSPMLAGLVREWGGEATLEGSVPDEYGHVEERIAGVARAHGVVLTAGGTSVGRQDHTVRALDALGEVCFRGVRVRPGRPVTVATLPEHDAVAFAIPGKPISAHTAAVLVARPFFTGDASLPTVPATLARGVGVEAGEYGYAVPVTLEDGAAMPLGHVDSPLRIYEEAFDPRIVASSTRASRADGILFLDASADAGETVDVVPYGGLG